MEKSQKGIQEIDRRLTVCTDVENHPVRFYGVREPPFALHGLYNPTADGPFVRLPLHVAEQVNEGVAQLAYHTAGGRVRFRTDSPYLALKVRTHWVGLMPHMTLLGTAGFDVYTEQAGETVFAGVGLTLGGNDAVDRIIREGGYTNLISLPAGMKDLTVHFPLYGTVDDLEIGLAPDAVLSEAAPYADRPPVVFYGSSITQGGCASRPGNAYESMLSRRHRVDFLNLGFSGSARGEPVMADYIASLPMSLFVMAYDYNAPTAAHLAATHEPFYRTVRATHPQVPVIFITRPQWRYDEEARARREIVRATCTHALDRGERVFFVDGEQILSRFGGDGGTVDGCHPNDLGFACVADALDPLFTALLKEPGDD